MKLLLDENLAPSLASILSPFFPGSQHVRDCGLKGKPDTEVWNHAKQHGFVIASKDADFFQRALLLGPPPKVIWLRVGNCTTKLLEQLLISNRAALLAFESDPVESVLALS